MKKTYRSFTYLEVLIASSILSIAFSLGYMLFSRASYAKIQGERLEKAIYLAEEKMEEISSIYRTTSDEGETSIEGYFYSYEIVEEEWVLSDFLEEKGFSLNEEILTSIPESFSEVKVLIYRVRIEFPIKNSYEIFFIRPQI